MKGKTGKMKGGGMARKGVGMALKGGGMARKGTGSNAEPGGKVKKMAVGGMSEGPRGPNRGEGRPGMTRPGFAPGKPNMAGTPKTGLPRPGMSGGKGGPGSGQTIPQDIRGGMNAISQLPTGGAGSVKTPGMTRPPMGPENILVKPAPGSMMKKNGGKVSKYAKGGAVKMTAGSGSGSGRLEKVAAHKAAKRIPAANLKHGGKAKGK